MKKGTGMRNKLGGLLLVAVCALAAPALGAESPAETGTIAFCANLSPDEQSAPTYSNAVGRADFVLDRADLKLSWKISYKDLSSAPTAADIYGPQRPGSNASVQFELAPPSALKAPIAGSKTLTDGLLEYLLTTRLYVNILTTKYPLGELRGQVVRIPPGEACPPPHPPARSDKAPQ
jgi:hypothetical protein